MVPLCRTLDEVRAAGLADGANDQPLTQDQADFAARSSPRETGTGQPEPEWLRAVLAVQPA